MKISNRLKSIAGLITEKDVIADIGCDHAYLDIYLVKNKIVPKAYVSDVNLNALTLPVLGKCGPRHKSVKSPCV